MKTRNTSTKKHIHAEFEATSTEEDDWSPNKIHIITKRVHSTNQASKDGQLIFATTALVNNHLFKLINDSGSPAILIPKQLFTRINQISPLRPLETEYRDVNNDKIKFEVITTANVKTNRESNNLELLVTTKKTNPFLGLDWMKNLGTS